LASPDDVWHTSRRLRIVGPRLKGIAVVLNDWVRQGIWLCLVCFALLLPGSGVATPVPVELRASLLLRTLAYDRNLATRAGERVDILVLEGSDPADTRAMATTLEGMADRVSVGGLPVHVERITFTTSDVLMAHIEAGEVDVLYLGRGLESEAALLSVVAEALSMTLVGSDGADMPNGCAVGFTVEENRPLIVIDRARAEAAGMDLDASVLQVARVL
jgi:hypothetical protein